VNGQLSSGSPSSSTAGPAPAAVRKVTATAATLEGPITTGEFNGPADPRPIDLAAAGYVQEEYFAGGTASSYASSGERSADGHWTVTPSGSAPYKTRFVVRRPKDPSRFSGTVVVEWLNVSVVETAPDWAYAGPAIIDAGAAWVGVSAQAVAINGGRTILQSSDPRQASSSCGLRNTNPTRYGTLQHPGDTFAFDMYSQIGAALRSPGQVPVFGTSAIKRLIAAGESQSASYLTAYINGVDKLANVYDGFFVHSRGSSAAAFESGQAERGGTPYRIRDDLDVPVMVFETETDVGPLLRYGLVQQDDSPRLRVWEVPGTAHADAFLVGGNFSVCPYPVNSGPQHYVATAALAATMRWVETGTPPPTAPRIQTTGDGTEITRDQHGLALGGIRTPSVDVPVATLTGQAEPGAPILCALFGKTTPFDDATIKSLYATKNQYTTKFDTALDAAISAGFVRSAERAEFSTEAQQFEFPP